MRTHDSAGRGSSWRALPRGQSVQIPNARPIRNRPQSQAGEIGKAAEPCSAFRCCARRAVGVDRHLAPGGAAVHRQADRAGRRPSPTRQSSRSRTCGCSTRCRRARASSPRRWSSRPRPPRCCKSSPFAGRAGAGVPGHAGECDAHLRGQVRQCFPVRGRRLPRWRMHGAPPALPKCLRRKRGPLRVRTWLGTPPPADRSDADVQVIQSIDQAAEPVRDAFGQTRRRAHASSPCRCSRRTS